MDYQISGQVRTWLRLNRPELSQEEKELTLNRIMEEIAPLVKDAQPAGQAIITAEHLQQHYFKSAYQMIRDVFADSLPVEFKMFQQTPILFEMIEEMLFIAVKEGIFSSSTEVVSEEFWQDQDARKLILEIIKDIIS